MIKWFITTFCLMMGFLQVSAQSVICLSQLDLKNVTLLYGRPQVDCAVTGEPLMVADKRFEKGVGVLSESVIRVQLDGKAQKFSCLIGVNDALVNYQGIDISMVPLTDGTVVMYQTKQGKKQFVGIGSGDRKIEHGSVVFVIRLDGKEVFRSNRLTRGDGAVEVSQDLKGANLLELAVENAGDGLSGDHADWLNACIQYTGERPVVVASAQSKEALVMSQEVKERLAHKMSKLPVTSLKYARPKADWLINNSSFVADVYQSDGKNLVLSNGLVNRVFRMYPNLATIDIQNHMTGENMLRAVSNEGTLTIDGSMYSLGGLAGQEEFGYTQYEWIDHMQIIPNSFRVTDFYVSPAKPRLNWANKRWSLVKDWKVQGKELTFVLQGPREMKNVTVKLHYVLYDGLPTLSKWMEVENHSDSSINIDSFVLEQLAMAEPESPVELSDLSKFRKPNIHVESDWSFHGFIEKEADQTEHWTSDERYTSQCNYPLLTPCMLEVKLPLGPDVAVAPGDKFQSFRTWIMPFDSDDRDRKGLFLKRMYAVIAPWTTENPIMMHCTSSDPKVVKEAVDQCANTGYEMVILSFGSGVDMEDESADNYKKFRELNTYARSKGVELGGYSLLSSRWISDEVDVINPKTGKRGGMIFGSAPCLSSEWGEAYFKKIKKFYENTGFSVFENDGSYPGDVCASTKHAHHKGLNDSQWNQRKQIANLYGWMCANGIYMNIPDYGYMLSGGNKVGIGYREVNWSLPRERQLVLGRQVMYDGLWERPSSMCWTFVPLTQYHGGGAAATLEPLSEHLDAYKAHMFQNYGAGVQACYRGHRLYDTETTKKAVAETISWYKKYRDILNSDLLHLRRADGRDWDGVMHVNPALKEKGFILFFNPTSKVLHRTIVVPLYYTGLVKTAKIREQEGKSQLYTLDRAYNVSLSVTIPAHGYTWYVVE